MGSGGNSVPPAVDIVERRVEIHLYTPKTENRMCDAENDKLMYNMRGTSKIFVVASVYERLELMRVITLPSRMGLA
jgi:hypothetical protein